MPSDLLEMLKEKAQLHPVLPDKVAKIDGTIFDGAYPQRSDSAHRGVVNRGVRRQVAAPVANDDPVEQEAVVNEVEEVEIDDTSADNEANAENRSYNLRSRQTRGKMFLTYNPGNECRIADNSALVHTYIVLYIHMKY